MSGGYWDYTNDTLMDQIFGYSSRSKVRDVFEDREISELVYDVFNLLHSFDWYRSGDTCKDEWIEDKIKFKKKWLERKH